MLCISCLHVSSYRSLLRAVTLKKQNQEKTATKVKAIMKQLLMVPEVPLSLLI